MLSHILVACFGAHPCLARANASKPMDDGQEDEDSQKRTSISSLQGSLRDLEQCLMCLVPATCESRGPNFSPRTIEIYTAGPLSLKGPAGTIPAIPGLQPVPCGLSPLKAAVPAVKTASRVRRCALMNIDNNRESAMVICCFDSWRSLALICKQFNLGLEETPELLQQHERDIAAFCRAREENDLRLTQLLRDAKEVATQGSASDSTTDDQHACAEEQPCISNESAWAPERAMPACGLPAMNTLLDEMELEMEGARMNEELVSRLINRVEKLELEKAILKEELEQVRMRFVV